MITMLIVLLIFAIGSGLLTDLWFFALGDPFIGAVARGRIFSFLGRRWLDGYNRRVAWVESETTRRHHAEWAKDKADHDARLLMRGKTHSVKLDEFVPSAYEPVNWWKLLVCPRCFNVWLTICVFSLLSLTAGFTGWWWMSLIPFLGVSNLSLSLSMLARDVG